MSGHVSGHFGLVLSSKSEARFRSPTCVSIKRCHVFIIVSELRTLLADSGEQLRLLLPF